MSWLLSLRRADAVKQSDLVLAQHNGLLGPWRVTDASMHESAIGRGRMDVTLTLVAQGGDTSRPSMLQLHDEASLVPVLVPMPEPEPPEEQSITLRLKIELA